MPSKTERDDLLAAYTDLRVADVRDGTLKTCQMHYITHTDFPPKERNFTLAEPLELVSVSGIIADGEPHLHIVLSCGESEVWAGHLEPKSEVAYLAEIAILKFNALEMTRRLDPDRKVKLLGPKT